MTLHGLWVLLLHWLTLCVECGRRLAHEVEPGAFCPLCIRCCNAGFKVKP